MSSDTARAIETEEKALSLLPPGDSSLRKDLEKSLARFRGGGAADGPTTTQPTSRPTPQQTSQPT